MDNTQINNSSLLNLKREMFRNKIRKEFLEKRFKHKRGMKIKSLFQKIKKNQDNYNKDSDSDKQEISEESNDCFAVFQIGRGNNRQKLTYKILKSMKLFIQKNSSFQTQIYKVFKFCEEQLLDSQIEMKDYIPLLAEIIYLLQDYSNNIELQPLIVLLKSYTIHQEYSILQFIELLIQQQPNLIIQLEEYVRSQEDFTLIKQLCQKITYSNLKMILFLLNTIKNKDFFNLLEFYGLKNILIKNIKNENYGKLINKILLMTEWNDEESDNQSYQIFADASNVI